MWYLWKNIQRHSFVTETLQNCTFCAKTYKNEKSLREHVRAEHLNEGNIHQCEICNRNFLRKFYLKKHIEKNHGNKQAKYICNHCEKTFSENMWHEICLQKFTYGTLPKCAWHHWL